MDNLATSFLSTTMLMVRNGAPQKCPVFVDSFLYPSTLPLTLTSPPPSFYENIS